MSDAAAAYCLLGATCRLPPPSTNTTRPLDAAFAPSAGDDLHDYEEDICAASGAGSFNVLRCYVHCYGHDAPLRLAQRVGELERQRAELLARLPPHQQQHVQRRQVDAATEGEGALRWQMPPVILDEARFRAQFS